MTSLPENVKCDITPGLIGDDDKALPLKNLSVAAKLVDMAAEVCVLCIIALLPAVAIWKCTLQRFLGYSTSALLQLQLYLYRGQICISTDREGGCMWFRGVH